MNTPIVKNRLGSNNFIRNTFLFYSGVCEKKGKTILLILLFAPFPPPKFKVEAAADMSATTC